MRLYLMRHGIAIDREDPDCPPDPERYLTPKGIQRTRAAARGLRALRVKPTALLTSPYVRAVQTGEIICEVLGLDCKQLKTTDALKPEAKPGQVGGGVDAAERGSDLLRPRAADGRTHRPRAQSHRALHVAEEIRRGLPGYRFPDAFARDALLAADLAGSSPPRPLTFAIGSSSARQRSHSDPLSAWRWRASPASAALPIAASASASFVGAGACGLRSIRGRADQRGVFVAPLLRRRVHASQRFPYRGFGLAQRFLLLEKLHDQRAQDVQIVPFSQQVLRRDSTSRPTLRSFPARSSPPCSGSASPSRAGRAKLQDPAPPSPSRSPSGCAARLPASIAPAPAAPGAPGSRGSVRRAPEGAAASASSGCAETNPANGWPFSWRAAALFSGARPAPRPPAPPSAARA